MRLEIVVDTNIFLSVALNEPERSRIIHLTTDMLISAPDILPYEVGNALSALIKRKRLTAEEALQAYKAVDLIPVRLLSVDIAASLQIAFEYDVYTYDAYFLQCARVYTLPLLTLDKRMKQVARELDLRVMDLE